MHGASSASYFVASVTTAYIYSGPRTSVSTATTTAPTTTPITRTTSAGGLTAPPRVIPTVSAASQISFPDPRVRKENQLELHLRRLCDKRVNVCRAECNRPITPKTVMVVKSYGDVTFYNRDSGTHTTRKGGHYIHFDEDCLKEYLSIQRIDFFNLSDDFPWDKIALDPSSKAEMPQQDIDYLKDMGIRV